MVLELLSIKVDENARDATGGFLFGTTAANANVIQFWPVSPTGDFTLNHLYDFNDPGAQPFGSFGPMTAVRHYRSSARYHRADHGGLDDGGVFDTGSAILLSGLGIAFVFVLCRKVVA